jgi:hypothetical protein
MIIGPEPIIITDLISLRFAIAVFSIGAMLIILSQCYSIKGSINFSSRF